MNLSLDETPAEVFIGTGAGKPILEAMRRARRRIWVLCPYVDSDFLTFLAGRAGEGIDVQVTTSYDDELKKARRWGRKKSIFHHVIQHREFLADRRRLAFWIRTGQYVLTIFAMATLGLVLLNYPDLVERLTYGFETGDATRLLVGLPSGLVEAFLAEVAALGLLTGYRRTLRLYRYRYVKAFRFFLYRNPHFLRPKIPGLPFVHSKIYLVDDTVFLGSVNFTKSAFYENVETRVRLEGPGAVRVVETTFHEVSQKRLFGESERLPPGLFPEPRN